MFLIKYFFIFNDYRYLSEKLQNIDFEIKQLGCFVVKQKW